MNTEWQNDEELLSIVSSELYTPVVGDILDQLDRRSQFLPPSIRPLEPGMVVVGRAMTVLQTAVFGIQEEPFGLMTQALDALKPGEIYISSGGANNCANWGEIMTASAKARGAVGAVIDGYHRDTPQVLEQGFPVFSHGPYAQDSGPRMKVIDFRCYIEVGGVGIHDGDLIFGDVDGVLAIPCDLVPEVVTRALDKARAEKTVRSEIENGLLCSDAFAKYGVL